jgi:hypothetical protein
MAKKGEAGRTLGTALMSSLVDAVFDAFAQALRLFLAQPIDPPPPSETNPGPNIKATEISRHLPLP